MPGCRVPTTPRRWGLQALALTLGLVVAATTQVPTATAAPSTAAARIESTSDLPTTFAVSSFNLLGYGHTAASGTRKGWADGVTRMKWATQLMADHSLDLIGFQEMQKPQFKEFEKLVGSTYDLYPGNQLTTAAMANSIAWRRSMWKLIETRTMAVPYFHGNTIRMPYVLLQNRQTGREVWVYNSHNAADAHGPAQKWRNAATQLEVQLVNQLRTDYPEIPVLITGDKNDRDEYFCPLVTQTEMQAANGGGVSDGRCVTPANMPVDWTLGSSDVLFTSWLADRSRLVRRTTDHPLVVSQAYLPSLAVQQTETDHAVVLAIDGLRSKSLSSAWAHLAPRIHSLIATGASTLNARMAPERAKSLPNDVSILTGRPINPALGGHGVGWTSDPGTTVAAAAGGYVPSVFDRVHNYGLDTALFGTDPGLARLDASWNASTGAADVLGLDDGRDKITQFTPATTDDALVPSVLSSLATAPRAFTYVQLSALRTAGDKYGWLSRQYTAALQRTDVLVGQILDQIAASETLNGHTLVVVTAERGGTGATTGIKSAFGTIRVPFIVAGPGVAAASDLYALNPQLTNPGRTNPGYSSPQQPVRNGFVANLVTKQLGLPPVAGSTLDADQAFTVLPAYDPAS